MVKKLIVTKDKLEEIVFGNYYNVIVDNNIKVVLV
jgi:hypothetical protein